MEKIIDNFKSYKYNFLSNFYGSPVLFEGDIYNNSESAYQASKTKSKFLREDFFNIKGNEAKLKARKLIVRNDWNSVREDVMYDIVKDKFSRNSDIKKNLLETASYTLIEGNMHHDNFWGDCKCERCKNIKGRNKLGEILMKVRDEMLKK